MDSIKSRFGGKSLQKFSRKIRGRDSSELSISKPDSSGKGKEVSHPEPPPEYSYDEISTKVVSSSRDWHMPEHDEEPSYTPEFLSRSPDTKWIDIEMMGYWLQKCDDEHGDKCRRPFSLDTSTLGRPQWLIDVRRNCLIAGEPAHRYACLSYVWGGANTLKTDSENLMSLMQEGSLESHRDEIPKTIRDTISLVDQLGIPYLWVDSLCIVQDESESKHDQIQAMAGIYANAYVTVIAGNGWDANHGLRGIQGVTEPQPYSSIWYSRGWTFQEMVFSPRKIMFQYQLAIWECNATSWHEYSLLKTSSPLSNIWYKPSINRWNDKVQFSAWPDVKQYVSLVNDYTNRKLTYGEDGINAISSLLSVMGSSFSGGFISGLPEMFFNEALLWQPMEIMQRRSSSAGLNDIPSWSWAGWEGEIMKVEWIAHWSHLDLHQPPFSVSTQPSKPVLQVTPTVKWFYGNTLQERSPVNISSHIYIDRIYDLRLPLPAKWTYNGIHNQYLYDGLVNTASSYPLPIAESQYANIITARYLFCRTKRGFFKSVHTSEMVLKSRGLPALSIALQDKEDKIVGALNLNLGLTNITEPPDGTEYELVAISAGALVGLFSQSHDKTVYDLCDGIRWGHFGTSEMGYNMVPREFGYQTDVLKPSIIEFYYVFWIEWKDGIASRKGLGRVMKEAWDRDATEEIDLVLG